MEESEIKVKRAKLSKGGTIETTYIDEDGNEVTLKGKNVCHNDLKTAFAALVPFFADLTEQKEADRIDWSDLGSAENVDLLRKIEVNAISIGGSDSVPFVTLTGRRMLMTSKNLNLNSPGMELDSEDTEWDHVNELDIAVRNLQYEVKQYIVNKKWQVMQPELNFDGNPDDPFAEPGQTVDVESEDVEKLREIADDVA